MQFRSLVAGAALLLASLGASSPALANVRVVASTPAQGSSVAGPRVLTLTFEQAVDPSTAAVAVVMTAMPGMANHGEMQIRNFTTAWSEGNRKLTLTLRQPLRAGTYDLRWQAGGHHGDRASGKVTFDVK